MQLELRPNLVALEFVIDNMPNFSDTLSMTSR